MDFSLILLLILGAFFILFGIFVLFLPEVKEKGQKPPVRKEKEDRQCKPLFWFLNGQKQLVASILLVIFGLILTILVGTSQPSSSSTPGSSSDPVTSQGGSSSSSSELSSTPSSTTPSSVGLTWTVSFVTNLDGVVIEPLTANDQQTILEPDLLSLDYLADGWFTNPSLSFETKWDFSTNIVTSNLTLYLQSIVASTITFDTLGGTPIDALTLPEGDDIPTLQAPTKDGFIFVDWFLDEALTRRFSQTIVPENNLVLFAKWATEVSTVQFNSMNGSLLSPLTNQVGDSEVLPIPEKIDSGFLGWYTDVTLLIPAANPFVYGSEDITLYAKWYIKLTQPIVDNGNAGFMSISESGTVYGWGYNQDGTFGDGTENGILPFTRAIYGVLNEGETITSIKGSGLGSSQPFTIILTSENRMLSTGFNERGQLGNGTTINSTTFQPMDLSALNETEYPVSFGLGTLHGLLLTNENRVFAWGYGGDYSLGQGNSRANVTTPKLVTMIALEENEYVTNVFGYSSMSIALTNQRRMLVWGRDDQRFGLGNTVSNIVITPTEVILPSLTEGEWIVDSSTGGYFTLTNVFKSNLGRFHIWGSNAQYQFNNGSTTSNTISSVFAIDLEEGETLLDLKSGLNYMIALTSQGRVLTWGEPSFNKLGYTTNVIVDTPTEVTLPDLLDGEYVTHITSGGHNTAVSTNLGRVYAWGFALTATPTIVNG